MPICRVCGNSNLSCRDIFNASVVCAHSFDAGNSQYEDVLGSHPSTMCQIYHFPGHAVGVSPDRYRNKPQTQSYAFANL